MHNKLFTKDIQIRIHYCWGMKANVVPH